MRASSLPLLILLGVACHGTPSAEPRTDPAVEHAGQTLLELSRVGIRPERFRLDYGLEPGLWFDGKLLRIVLGDAEDAFEKSAVTRAELMAAIVELRKVGMKVQTFCFPRDHVARQPLEFGDGALMRGPAAKSPPETPPDPKSTDEKRPPS